LYEKDTSPIRDVFLDGTVANSCLIRTEIYAFVQLCVLRCRSKTELQARSQLVQDVSLANQDIAGAISLISSKLDAMRASQEESTKILTNQLSEILDRVEDLQGVSSDMHHGGRRRGERDHAEQSIDKLDEIQSCLEGSNEKLDEMKQCLDNSNERLEELKQSMDGNTEQLEAIKDHFEIGKDC
jgi:Tfp pilus assembly protein PilN